ncbi:MULTISPECIES: hypothetical protein [Massilia]|uniref:MFS transporter permease n=1 Tax=Massilia aurea TaxID=373040 RepID=A0A422QPF6_9BURK|nr:MULTISPECIES: hypothetical protein [Massilia]MDY0963252.1 hypothetical protein [Massilia sp. CFBP9026]RNF31865.1 hypothetical protein NM04_04660 [Massilia aurea]
MPALPLSTYLRLARASAAYDVIQILPFATPWTFALLIDRLSALNVWLGGAPLPPFAPLHLLLSSLLGTLVLLWCAVRLKEPSLRLGRFDGLGRLLFAFWIGWAMLEADLPVLWLFLVPELFWGVAQWWPVAQASGSNTPRAAFTSDIPMRSSRGG